MTSDDAVNPNDVPAPPTGEKPAAREEKSPEENSPDEKPARVRPVKPLKHQQGGGVVPKKAAIERARNATKPKDWSGLSVYILGFDSLSQMATRRSLPRTVKYLEDAMQAVVLNGKCSGHMR